MNPTSFQDRYKKIQQPTSEWLKNATRWIEGGPFLGNAVVGVLRERYGGGGGGGGGVEEDEVDEFLWWARRPVV